jgi:poly(3-hydroxyalkanoate) synthetase
LINRGYILDLAPNASLLTFLSMNGIRPFLLDWGASPAIDAPLTLERLILDCMEPALRLVQHATQRQPLVMGYCMGGTLATALTCLASQRVAGLALLATPWNFHHSNDALKSAASQLDFVTPFSCLIGDTPVDALQTLFAQLDPLAVPKKFAKFGRCPQGSASARRFVAIEDWLNDGVCLGADITKECLQGWYARNEPARGVWRVNGVQIRPDQLDLPVWIAVPEKDRLVPPQSSLALAEVLSGCDVLSIQGGHIGIVAGLDAEKRLWPHLLRWLKQIAALQKKPW